MLTFATVVVVLVVVAEAVVLASASSGKRIELDIIQGRLSGVEEKSVKGRPFSAFRNIPFAKPPVGPLRFKDPEPAEGWEGTRDASSYPPRCIQQPMVECFDEDFFVDGEEDCLYLNVYTPKVSVGSRLPVMVYIHGGAYISGESSSYPPHVLLERDVVLVVLQYRLGVFGFLSTEDSVIPGNFGLKDQTLALRWVQQNIGFFGGDANRVTIIGQSAGSASVQFQMLIPEAKGLFSRAIMHSGSVLNGWATDNNHRETALRIAEAMSCPSDQGSENILECLQKVSATTLVSHHISMTQIICLPFLTVPRVDGSFIPDQPARLIASGRFHKVPVITGATEHDGGIISQYLISRDNLRERVQANISLVATTLGFNALTPQEAEDHVRLVFDHFLGGFMFDGRNADIITQIYTDILSKVGGDVSSLLHSRHHPVFAYQLRHRGKKSFTNYINSDYGDDWVIHFDDLIYLFEGGVFEALDDITDLALRDIMVTLWTNFAATGNPTPDDSMGFKWEATPSSSLSQLVLLPEPFMETNASKRLNFWLNLPALQHLKETLEGKTKDEL